jgi:methylated-DNA-[protein]-cysteine S-methyltransferase
MNDLYHVTFQTKAGWMGLMGSSNGLSRVTFPFPSQEKAVLDLGRQVEQSVFSRDHFKDLIENFEAYFKGYPVDFTGDLDLSRATPFETQVWKTTQSIPYGETRSYRWVAVQIGKPLAPRAVGQALGRNCLPVIIPCHRVLTSDGKLGGFGGGLDMKRFLLDLEAKGKKL